MTVEPKRGLVLYSAPVRIALEEAQVKYDFVSFPLDERPDDYVKNVYPAGKVPLMVYGGIESFPDGKLLPGSAVITESLVILEFLADLYPDARLLPEDPVKRSQARIFMNTLNLRMADDVAKWLTNNDEGEAYLDLLEALQATMPEVGYVVGEWSIADAALLPFLLVGYYVRLHNVEHVKAEWASPRFARLRQHYDQSIARPSTSVTWDEVCTPAFRCTRAEPIGSTYLAGKCHQLLARAICDGTVITDGMTRDREGICVSVAQPTTMTGLLSHPVSPSRALSY
ncbi:hypothetical protein BD311DRAFT_789550 [Dichomitus squalens]|uniref:GST N-terminal domain-containing protein n=1 Tax=Dichomitus squalens TaxID=114155 RepID=A0A4V2JZY2_9APHY|nr:hypothetical protein BD311DRAFT_789550 [Dichomitus squalens]